MEHLETYARSATRDDDVFRPKKPNVFKVVGEHLGVSFAASNPRKLIKKAQSPIGNLPLEILTYLAAYTDDIIGNGQLPIPMTQTMACKSRARSRPLPKLARSLLANHPP